MYETKFPTLLSPIRVGNVTFRNRIAASPIGTHEKRIETMTGSEFYAHKARGGASAVTIGETTVDREHGQPLPGFIPLDTPDCVPKLALLADSIKKHGALACVELMHTGQYSSYSFLQGNRVFGPVGGKVEGMLFSGPGMAAGMVADAATEEDIQHAIDMFANAAFNVMTAGFDMVSVYGCHGMLLSTFMSPIQNTRTDKWGGSLENRMRFAVEVCKAIRAKCGPGLAIEFRMSGDEAYPGGYTIEDGIEMAKVIQDYVDMIHVSTGIHENPSGFIAMCPSMFYDEMCNLKYAEAIKKNVRIPVAAVGMFNDPYEMEKVLAEGKVDIIELGRALIADPDLPKKVMAGKPEEIRKCLRCYTCYSSSAMTNQFSCAVNPEIGREYESKHEFTKVEPKKVLIAGGGIGGMQAALTAAKLGHKVILCEKADKLGGVLLCEEKVEFKYRMSEYLEYQANHVLSNPNIEVRLNTKVTKELAQEISPDAIISAMGSKSIVPSFIKGYDGKNIINAEDIYKNIDKAGNNVVILGGGLVGIELAIYLRKHGKNPTIIEMQPAPNFGGNIIHGAALTEQVMINDIKMALSTRAISVSEKGVTGMDAEGEKFFEADTVVNALGMRPCAEDVNEIRFCAPEFYAIGFSRNATTIAQATCEGHYAALNIGR